MLNEIFLLNQMQKFEGGRGPYTTYLSSGMKEVFLGTLISVYTQHTHSTLPSMRLFLEWGYP